MSTTAPLAQFEKVSKTYESGWFQRKWVQALIEVDFTVEAGQAIGLLGPNRAGKTTLLKILLDVCFPSEGTVQRFGKSGKDRSQLGRIGYVHENHAFPRYLTATEILNFYGTLAHVSADRLYTDVPKLLAKVGLADRANEPIGQFSKGMLQRLGLAQALVNDPDLLVLDEPTEGLDHTGRSLIRGIVAEQKKKGGSVILVSHVLTEVQELCERVAVLNKGRLIYAGKMEELLEKEGKRRTLEQALVALYEEKKATV